jgi:hypothetical protein
MLCYVQADMAYMRWHSADPHCWSTSPRDTAAPQPQPRRSSCHPLRWSTRCPPSLRRKDTTPWEYSLHDRTRDALTCSAHHGYIRRVVRPSTARQGGSSAHIPRPHPSTAALTRLALPTDRNLDLRFCTQVEALPRATHARATIPMWRAHQLELGRLSARLDAFSTAATDRMANALSAAR